MRIFVGLAFAIFACLASAQDYIERWRVPTPGTGSERIFWGRPRFDATDNVLVAGTVTNVSPNDQRQPIAMKLTSDGDEVWQTRGVAGPNLSSRDLNVDRAGNPYFLVTDFQAGTVTVRSLNGTDGSFRWERTFSGISFDQNNKRNGFDLIAETVGNSTFVYFAFSEANNTIRLHRLNPTNGQIQFATTINGSLNGRASHVMEIDATGNIILMLQNVNAIATKRNQSLALVWNRVTIGTEDSGIALHPTTGEIAFAVGTSSFQGPITMEVLDPVSGTPRRTATDLPHPSDGTAGSEIFGHPTGAWYFGGRDAFGTRALDILTPTLKVQSQRSIQFGFPTADSSGMLHGQQFDRPAILNWPRQSTFDPVLGGNFTSAIGVDSRDRLTLAASVSGIGVLVQYDQKFLAGTDTFAEPFNGSLEIEAPGILANDTLSRGGTLAIVTSTTKGSLTLRQDGGFTYTPNATFNGADQFQYRLTNNGIARTATCFIKQLKIASLTITNNPVIGSEFNIEVKLTLSSGASNFFRDIPIFGDPANIIPNLPRTLSFRPGEVSQNTFLTTPAVAANTNVTLFASLGGQTSSTVLTLLPGAFEKFTVLSDAPLYEGLPSKIRLQLKSATVTGRTFDMAYQGDAVASGPAQVVVAPGQTFADFQITMPDDTAGQQTILAYFKAPGVTTGSALRVEARPHLEFAATGIVYADFQHRYQVEISKPAGNIAIPVTNSSNNGDVVVPTINIPVGQTAASAAFTPRTGATNQVVTVTSRLLTDTMSFSFLVRPNLLETFTVSPQVIGPFSTTTGRVTFNWVATGDGIPVKISTTTPTLVIVPSEVTMQPGQTVLTFPIAARGKAGNAKVTVKVGLKTITKGITITSP